MLWGSCRSPTGPAAWEDLLWWAQKEEEQQDIVRVWTAAFCVPAYGANSGSMTRGDSKGVGAH